MVTIRKSRACMYMPLEGSWGSAALLSDQRTESSKHQETTFYKWKCPLSEQPGLNGCGPEITLSECTSPSVSLRAKSAPAHPDVPRTPVRFHRAHVLHGHSSSSPFCWLQVGISMLMPPEQISPRSFYMAVIWSTVILNSLSMPPPAVFWSHAIFTAQPALRFTLYHEAEAVVFKDSSIVENDSFPCFITAIPNVALVWVSAFLTVLLLLCWEA